LPAVRAALAESDGLRRLELVYGPSPRTKIALLTLLSLVLGFWFENAGPEFPGKAYVTWPAVALGLVFAMVLRYFLFRDGNSDQRDDCFPLLAASLIPGVVILLLGIALFGDARVSLAPETRVGGVVGALGNLALWVTGLLGIVAAIAISVASLCYSRNWIQALIDLAMRLLVFRIMVWVMALIMIEVSIVGTFLTAIVEGLFSIAIPDWLPQLADQLSYAALLSLAYLAVIGGTWTTCRDSYPRLQTHRPKAPLRANHESATAVRSGPLR
jgi:hypothetical protein